MDEIGKSKVIELTRRAIAVNEKLLADEKKFVTEAVTSSNVGDLKEKNEQLIDLIRKERLYIEAANSMLEKMLEKGDSL